MGTPWDPHPSSWQATQSGGIPTYPGKGQVHLQFGDAASNTGTNPVAEGDGAEGVVRGAISPEPALRQEPLRLREVGLIVGHRVVRQDKEGLWGKKWGLMTPPGPTEHSGGPHGTALTHILGEEVVSNDNVLLIEDPGVGGHHRVDSGIWGELVGEEDSPGDPRGREPRQDRAQQLPGGGRWIFAVQTDRNPALHPAWLVHSPRGRGWDVPQSLLDNSPKHRQLGDILSSRKPVGRHNSFQLLVQGLLDVWVPGEVVQGPGQRVGGLGEWSTRGSEGIEQPCAKHSTSTAPESPCSGAQKSQG